MGRLIDIDVLFDYFGNDAIDKTTRSNIEYFVSEKGTVEELKQESTTKNDLGVDCISREQAIKQCGFGMTSLLIADNLRKLPPVAPQSRKGHWEHGRELSRVFIGDALRGINYEDWHCSNCHCVIEQSIKPKWNYCPNCGADMREVVEDGNDD